MALNMIVTVKQVPDTQHVSENAMKPDGTVNRGALPTITNPEDLNALEEALKLKERYGGHVSVVTMGPPSAVKTLKECLSRGADDAIILSDRIFAGSDTLATSYILKCAVERIGNYDLILCGRQAIDGDTAQVGPQLAEKLNINQITGLLQIRSVEGRSITVRRAIEEGYEIVRSRLPVLLTVGAAANEPRPPSAKRTIAFKNIERKLSGESYGEIVRKTTAMEMIRHIREWNAKVVGADPKACGLSGSPTKVKRVRNVVLSVTDVKRIPATKEGINGLIRELTSEHIIG